MQRKAPETTEDWIGLWREYCRQAHVLFKNKSNKGAWIHAGFAVECALKAAIMAHQRHNRWPPKELKPAYYVHDLASLASHAGINLREMNKDPIFVNWLVVREWQRGDTYDVKPMRSRVAEDMLEAACGAKGVIQWLMNRFHLVT